ncbi:MAG: SPASM domain-containing protein [Planctomycetes bacterium]|nr:SPASM domain-containing protein [Planctomycetota bacterium]
MRPVPRFLADKALGLLYGDFPRTVRLESTSHCNAKCITCPHAFHERPQGIMSEELYLKILDECVREKVRKLHLHNFGEPLIDKMLPRRVELAKKRGIPSVKIISNGSLLSEERARALIEAGLDEIKVSFDGLSREVFERVRKPLKYEAVAGNVEGLVRFRNEMGRKNPRVELLFVSIQENETEEADFVDRWRGVVDHVDVTRAHNWGGDDKVAKSSVPKQPTGYPCMRLWQTFTILWDGRVALCCLDYEGREILGDLSAQSMRDVWHGARLAEIRRSHLQGSFADVPICAHCNAR